ncbi:hypothetical protein AB9P05_01100 [Roseivirga sp. BDSF3-8]|uniref:hypothetical protein n=1 Tax=Roseivirga sp. BDSF3-8 TaxID=3241598 RepID=UPI003531D7FF
MMKTRKENFDSVRQYGLKNVHAAGLFGGTGDGGTTGSSGGGAGESEDPPPIWIDDNSSARMSTPIPS